MAEYYFCNGTTRRNTPCQIHVQREGDRCRHHGDGGGPRAAYKAGRKALEAICHVHNVYDAMSAAYLLASKALDILRSLVAGSGLNRSQLENEFLKNELDIILKLDSLSEQEMTEYSAICNYLIALMDVNGNDQPVNSNSGFYQN